MSAWLEAHPAVAGVLFAVVTYVFIVAWCARFG